jgi:hypothetical protein
VRTYTDREGIAWQVYHVQPSTSANHLPDDMQSGWLCFEAADLKRRLAPVPVDWERCTSEQLESYRARAVVARRREH